MNKRLPHTCGLLDPLDTAGGCWGQVTSVIQLSFTGTFGRPGFPRATVGVRADDSGRWVWERWWVMFGPATSKLSGVMTTMVLVAVMLAVVSVPQAQAAFPGRNGALLVAGTARASKCDPPPPRVVGRIADDYEDPCPVARAPFAVSWLGGTSGTRLLAGGERFPIYDLTARISPGGRLVAISYEDSWAVLPATFGGSGSRWPSDEARLPGGRACWLPGGRSMIVQAADEDALGNVGVVGAFWIASVTRPPGVPFTRLRSAEPRRVFRGFDPACASNGWLAYRTGNLYHQYATPVYASASLHSVARKLADSGLPLDWSPDGRSLLISRRSGPLGPGLYGVNAESGRSRRIAFSKPSVACTFGRAVWSPDGRKVAFQCSPSATNSRVFVVSARTTKAQGPTQWRTVVEHARLLDWRPLPTGSRR